MRAGEQVRIEGLRIVLRDVALGDLDGLAFWLQSEQRWRDLDGPYYAGPTPEDIERMIARRRAQILDRDFPTPRDDLVIADRGTGILLGHVTFYWQSEETAWLSVGVGLYDPDRWGKGLGYEALGLWGDYLFEAMPQLVRLDLRTWSGNAGMMRLAEKVGFVEEARFRNARIVNGEYFDGMGYGVLREEWHERYPDGFAQALGHEPMKHRRSMN